MIHPTTDAAKPFVLAVSLSKRSKHGRAAADRSSVTRTSKGSGRTGSCDVSDAFWRLAVLSNAPQGLVSQLSIFLPSPARNESGEGLGVRARCRAMNTGWESDTLSCAAVLSNRGIGRSTK